MSSTVEGRLLPPLHTFVLATAGILPYPPPAVLSLRRDPSSAPLQNELHEPVSLRFSPIQTET